jgi:hypothetical protein
MRHRQGGLPRPAIEIELNVLLISRLPQVSAAAAALVARFPLRALL